MSTLYFSTIAESPSWRYCQRSAGARRATATPWQRAPTTAAPSAGERYAGPYKFIRSMHRRLHNCTFYCTIVKKQISICISRFCPILDLTIVLGRPRHAHAKHGVSTYPGPTTSRENAIRQYFTHMYAFSNFHCDYDLNLCE
jgi:hypothetical protein